MLPLRPPLGQEDTGFNRLTETDFVGEDRAREGRAKREQGRLHLVRIEIDLSVRERAGEFFHAVRAPRFVSSYAKYFA